MTRLALGTAQFGLDYGIANKTGQIGEGDAAAILARATERGIALLDTAPAYGDAEVVLGRLGIADRFDVITKTPHIGHPEAFRADEVRAASERSCERLKIARLSGLLIHHPDDIRGLHADALFDVLLELKSRGCAEKIGISIYDETDLDAFGRLDEVDIVQLPASIIDQRLLRNGTFARLRAAGIEIHVRSLFLQGLVLIDPTRTPDHVAGLRPLLTRLKTESANNRLSAALTFARKELMPDVAIVGIDGLDQLDAICDAWQVDLDLDWSTYAGASAQSLDPRLWPKHA